jgi:hypothetical protein
MLSSSDGRISPDIANLVLLFGQRYALSRKFGSLYGKTVSLPRHLNSFQQKVFL